jgi:hypothetical protein
MRDHGRRSAHARLVVLQCVMEVAPCVSPTANLHQPAFRIGEKAVVNNIGIGLRVPLL